MNRGFSEADIRQLVRGSTDDDRAVAAHRLCCRIDEGLADHERKAAAEVLRIMAADAAEIVRRALAVTLKASTHLPRDVALRLAADVETIASPVLAFSPAFTDADLCEIVRGADPGKQAAVGRRPALSRPVCSAIAAHAEAATVTCALSNEAALFAEGDLQRALDRFGGDETLTSTMAYRRVLPLTVTERLVTLVSENVRRHLVDRHALSPETAMQVVLGAQERSTLELVEEAEQARTVAAFVMHLHAQDRLTASLILRALAHGYVTFVEHALAALAGLAHHRAWLLVHDAGPRGLRAIFDKAGLPERLFPAFRVGLDTFRSVHLENGDAATVAERMLERFLTSSVEAPRQDVEDLVERFDAVRQRRFAPA